MSRNLSSFVAIGLVFLFPAGALLAADQPSSGEMRMREALRNTMLQLRAAEVEKGNLQAAQVESDAQKKALTAKFDALVKQTKADRDASDKSIAALKSKAADQETEIAQMKESLAKTEASYKQSADLAGRTEKERARLANDVILLKRHVADQRTKNEALFKLGKEILTRYEKFGLGDALTAKEPFVGISRVKLENFVQDYSDKLSDQQITSSDATATPAHP